MICKYIGGGTRCDYLFFLPTKNIGRACTAAAAAVWEYLQLAVQLLLLLTQQTRGGSSCLLLQQRDDPVVSLLRVRSSCCCWEVSI